MAKAPGPDAKTRLSPLLDAPEREALAAALLQDTLELAVKMARASEAGGRDSGPLAAGDLATENLGAGTLQVFVACAPRVEAPAFAPLLEDWGPFRALRPVLVPQCSGDLGLRIRTAAAVAFAQGVEALLVLGTDSPDLTPAVLSDAFDALLGTDDAPPSDLVFLPALDGGYCLGGMKRIESTILEDIPWSTPEVLWWSLLQARKAKRTFALLDPVWRDIDRPDDLRAFYLAGGGAEEPMPPRWNPYPGWLDQGASPTPGQCTRAWLSRFCQTHPSRWSLV